MRLESVEVLQYFDSASVPIIIFDKDCKINFWNKGAETLIGYTREDVLGRELYLDSGESMRDFKIALERAAENKSLLFRSLKSRFNGEKVELLVKTSPLFVEGEFEGMLLFVLNFKVVKKIRRLGFVSSESKRTFNVLREMIMISLIGGKLSINQIANTSGINWKTVEKHLTFLIGKKMIAEVFCSEYIRIFELTSRGVEKAEFFKERKVKKFVKGEIN